MPRFVCCFDAMRANQAHAQSVMRRLILFVPLAAPALAVAFSDRETPARRILDDVGAFFLLFLLFAGALPELLARVHGRATAAKEWRSAALHAGLLAAILLIPQVLLWILKHRQAG